jgi:hypothetical protein
MRRAHRYNHEAITQLQFRMLLHCVVGMLVCLGCAAAGKCCIC